MLVCMENMVVVEVFQNRCVFEGDMFSLQMKRCYSCLRSNNDVIVYLTV